MERCGPGTGRNPKRTPGKRQAAGGRLARESRAAAELHRTYKHCSLLASKHLLVLYDPPHPTQNPSFSAPDTAPVVPVNRAAIPRYRSLAAALLRLASLPPTPRRRLLSLPPFTPSLSSRVPAYQSVGEEEGTRPGRSVGRSVGGLSDLAAASPFVRWDLAPWPPSRRPRPPRRHRFLLLLLLLPPSLSRIVSFVRFRAPEVFGFPGFRCLVARGVKGFFLPCCFVGWLVGWLVGGSKGFAFPWRLRKATV